MQKSASKLLVLAALLGMASFSNELAADEPASSGPSWMAKPGKLIFSDDFSRPELGDTWTLSVRSFSIAEGVMIGAQRTDATHPAVSRVVAEFQNVLVQFKFKFDGGRFTFVFNDRDFKDSHAGHICRVGVSPQSISLGDDKEGNMKHGIYELWKDIKTRPQAEELTKGRSARFPVKLETGKWYPMTIEIVGDEMLAAINGQPVGYLRSPGLAHATKNYWGFTVSGRSMAFDDLQAFAAEANPDWPSRREAVLGMIPRN